MSDAIRDYDYELPEELIAQVPLEDRAASRLLHLDRKSGSTVHRQFRDCVQLLERGDLLVMNNTRVSAFRLFGKKPSGGHVEALVLDELADGCVTALVKPARRLPVGATIIFENELEAVVTESFPDGRRALKFPDPAAPEILRQLGQVPLPPYIREKIPNASRYQTVYASKNGSAAAPTAGLHFTEDILESIRSKGVNLAYVTLDVGLDTFRPISAEYVSDHEMHGEWCEISPETASAINGAKGRIIAVGTTSVRTLETFACGRRTVEPGRKHTHILITPGYSFQIIDGMFTNFHMPRTTMLLMLAALCGREPLMQAYQQAVQHRYRFLSFGDSMLLL